MSSWRACQLRGTGDKSGKSRFALTAPRPALVNFDRAEDWLVHEMGLDDILRDRIIVPPVGADREVTPAQAKAAMKQAEADIKQAQAFAKGGAVETLIFDGGSLFLDLITIVTLDEAKNPNNTYRYAGRNAYVNNLFNELNASGLNVIWTSKAKPLWVANQRVPNMYVPDTHDNIPFLVDVNVQFVTEKSPEGMNFYGVFGTNAFNPVLVDKRVLNLDWALMGALLGLGGRSR